MLNSLFGGFLNWLLWESLKSTGYALVATVILFLALPLVIYAVGSFIEAKDEKEKKEGSKAQVGKDERARKPYLHPRAYESDYLGQRLEVRPEATTKQEAEDWIRRELAESGCLRFAVLETLWHLDPPCGPKPKTGWSNPPFSLRSQRQYTVYVVELDVNLSDGTVRTIHKAGITGKDRVLGPGGRFNENSKVRRVVTRMTGLTAREAWEIEQKMLCLMPLPEWSQTFEEKIATWIGSKAFNERPTPLLSDRERNRLGPSEWREWYWGDKEIKKTLGAVTELTRQTDRSELGVCE